MALEAKQPTPPELPGAPAARTARTVRTTRAHTALRLLHALLLVALGSWLSVRALQTLWPRPVLPAALAFGGAAGSTGRDWAFAALILGGALLAAALALPWGRAGAWAAAALLALVALALQGAAWALGARADWLSALLAFAAIIALAAPAARTLYLGDASSAAP